MSTGEIVHCVQSLRWYFSDLQLSTTCFRYGFTDKIYLWDTVPKSKGTEGETHGR